MIDPDFLSVEEVEAIHAEQLAATGGQEGVRDPHGLASAVGQAQMVFQYVAGADLYDLAAAYGFFISQNQPFVDGNKRTGLNAALLFLELNDARVPPDGDYLYRAMMRVAAWSATRGELADVLRKGA